MGDMKLTKVASIVFFLAMGTALIVVSANAQSPSAAPTTNAQVGIPEEAPQYWTAEGGTQGQWTAMREHCSAVFAEMELRGRMKDSRGGGLPPPGFGHQQTLYCENLSVSFAHSGPASTSGSAPSGGAMPTPKADAYMNPG
jgi:hypothetical protein